MCSALNIFAELQKRCIERSALVMTINNTFSSICTVCCGLSELMRV